MGVQRRLLLFYKRDHGKSCLRFMVPQAVLGSVCFVSLGFK